MKNYFGDAAGNVTRRDLDNLRVTDLGNFEWGDAGSRSASLALALVIDLIGDQLRAEKIYRRFLHRTVATWAKGRPWGMSEPELMKVIEEIDKVAAETAPLARQMAREVPAMQIDSAPPGGGWDLSPDIEPNIKKEK